MTGDNNGLDKDKLSNKEKNEKKTGEHDNMAVTEKELKDMQKLQQKQRKPMTREEMRKAILDKSIKKNHEALHRLSQT